MRNIFVAFVTTVLLTVTAYATHLDCARAAYGFCNVNPTLIEAKNLWDAGFELNRADLIAIADDDGSWWVGYENPAKNYDYLICCYTAIEGTEETTCNWQAGLDSPTEHCNIFYWNNEQNDWTWAGENESGYEPPTEHTDVNTGMVYAEEILIIMTVGYTPGAGNWIKADVVDIDYTQ
jgi:hypothetical protein